MCIIVAKEKGVALPSKNTLKTCFEHNSDGSGLMYVKNGKVVIEKGLMTFGDFWHKIKELKREFNSDLTDKALVMHFRIGTHGENDKATTHPFAISNNADDLRATYFETDIAMAHNGIIRDFNYDKVLSDTQSFVKDYVSVFKDLNKDFYKNERVMKLITDKANISSNKLCFLDKDENIYYYGNKVVDNGVIYSNSTYKEPKVTYSYSSYHWNYDNWYDWDYGYTKPSNWYDNYHKKTETKTQDIAKKQIKYAILEEGDFYQSLSGADFVGKGEKLYVDKEKNLYEKIGDKLSLIGTKVMVYDKNWQVKELNFS
jgi:predicted glutamine amidotransferase